MDREGIIAHLNLFAVLPRMAELVSFDPEAAQIAQQLNLGIVFRVLDGPRMRLGFAAGRVSASPTSRGLHDVGLLFRSCDQLNRSFAGQKVTPIPYRGFWKLGAMGRFTSLSDLLTRYLQPTPQDMADAPFRAKAVHLMLLTGLSSLPVVAQHDPKVKALLGKPKDGTVCIDVSPDGPRAHVVIRGGHIAAHDGAAAEPTATITLRGVDTAARLLTGKLDVFAAMGTGEVRISGLLTLADEVNWLLDRVGTYLA